jgi:hypothetical protein
MFTDVNLSAPIGALAFLGTAFLLLLGLLLFIFLLALGKPARARIVLSAMALIGSCYLLCMIAFSLISHDHLLAKGEEKHFCELDCHLAYSLVGTRQVRTLGEAPQQLTAHGAFTIVTIRTRFDETTIAPWRGNGQLYPNNRALALLDEHGHRYLPSETGQSALAALQSGGTPLNTPLRPAESYTTDIVFDLPPEAKNGRLLITEADWPTLFIIGHENSLWHKQTTFEIKSFAGS